MSSLSFSQELAFSIYTSEEDYPVDLDDAWQWLGYDQKSNCLNKLKNNFEEGEDFSSKSVKSSTGGRPRTAIFLTVDVFKSLGMMAGTSQGKAIRKYFLECEKIAKTRAKTDTPKPLAAYTERVRSMHEDFKNIPKDHWCILHESANLLIWIESVMKYPVDRGDIVDASIGIQWANHRKGKQWAKDRTRADYKFPKGIEVFPWTYHYDELSHFKRFMEDLYKPKFLPQYLERKYGKLVKSQQSLLDLL